MKTFTHKSGKIQITVCDHKVHEGLDSFWIQGENITLPKESWKLEEKKTKKTK